MTMGEKQYEELSERLDRKETVRGTALTIAGGFFWGLAGVFGKYSFEYKGVTAPWLVNVRLIIAILYGSRRFQCWASNGITVHGTGYDHGASGG